MATATGLETELIIEIAQVVEGDEKCHCGADAVLAVTTQPDNEPGLTCWEHASPWIESSVGLTRKLFGPKEA